MYRAMNWNHILMDKSLLLHDLFNCKFDLMSILHNIYGTFIFIIVLISFTQ